MSKSMETALEGLPCLINLLGQVNSMGSLALLQLNIADRQLLHVREHLLHASLDVGNVLSGTIATLELLARGVCKS